LCFLVYKFFNSPNFQGLTPINSQFSPHQRTIFLVKSIEFLPHFSGHLLHRNLHRWRCARGVSAVIFFGKILGKCGKIMGNDRNIIRISWNHIGKTVNPLSMEVCSWENQVILDLFKVICPFPMGNPPFGDAGSIFLEVSSANPSYG
jgi:hypothetical protein